MEASVDFFGAEDQSDLLKAQFTHLALLQICFYLPSF